MRAAVKQHIQAIVSNNRNRVDRFVRLPPAKCAARPLRPMLAANLRSKPAPCILTFCTGELNNFAADEIRREKVESFLALNRRTRPGTASRHFRADLLTRHSSFTKPRLFLARRT